MTAAAAAFRTEAPSRGGVFRRARSLAEIDRAHAAIRRIGDLSDNLVGVGPFGVGLDGLLAWVPIVGTVYSVGAGAVLLLQGWRAHVAPERLAVAAAIMGLRTLVGEVPILGDVVVDLVRGHRYSARLLQRGIERTLYVEGRAAQAQGDPALRARMAAAKRVVFLGD